MLILNVGMLVPFMKEKLFLFIQIMTLVEVIHARTEPNVHHSLPTIPASARADSSESIVKLTQVSVIYLTFYSQIMLKVDDTPNGRSPRKD